MNYRIRSGHLVMSSRFFGREILKAGSYLRWLIGLEGRWSKKVTGISREGTRVHVRYQRDDLVYLNDDFTTFIEKVKEDYQGEMEGTITVAKLRGMVDFIDVTVKF